MDMSWSAAEVATFHSLKHLCLFRCDVPLELSAVSSVRQVGHTALAAEAGTSLKNDHTLDVRLLPCDLVERVAMVLGS
jgi:hypothetical protein